MTNESPLRFSDTLSRLARESSRRGSDLHQLFLSQREVSLRGVQALIELQIRAAGGMPPAPVLSTAAPARPMAADRPAVFTSAQLDAFGTGKLSDCLGPNFTRYDAMRMPRIPNGDLKMMSRITAISGKAGDFNHPSSVTVEYDVPDDCWYLRDNAGPELPFSLVMETALQPCGFLMAYLDVFAALPLGEYYFRNLDGWIVVDQHHAIRGKRILTRARMLSSVSSGGALMQKFAFELTCDDQPFCHGETLFGYFPAAAMTQVGLDGGKSTLTQQASTWMQQHPGLPGVWVDLNRRTQADPACPRRRLSSGRMRFLDTVFVQKDGGRYGKGYVYAERGLQANDWFYPFHFYQDPVMPGSLGVEAILQAAQAYGLETGLGASRPDAFFGLAEGVHTQWRYRGQIVQSHQKMEIEIHVNAVQEGPQASALIGDASLWVDGLRIYEVKNAAIGIYAGIDARHNAAA